MRIAIYLFAFLFYSFSAFAYFVNDPVKGDRHPSDDLYSANPYLACLVLEPEDHCKAVYGSAEDWHLLGD